MKIRELFENINQDTTIGICYGRWNPPHKGHAKVWEDASECDHWLVGTNEHTRNEKNPLPFDVKVKCMETVYPEITGHIVAAHKVFELATEAYNRFGGNADLKVYTDEDWIVENLERYNGVESKHGYYKFNSISQAVTPRITSATALRTAVLEDNREQFSSAAGISSDTHINLDGKEVGFFDLVARYLKEYKS